MGRVRRACRPPQAVTPTGSPFPRGVTHIIGAGTADRVPACVVQDTITVFAGVPKADVLAIPPAQASQDVVCLAGSCKGSVFQVLRMLFSEFFGWGRTRRRGHGSPGHSWWHSPVRLGDVGWRAGLGHAAILASNTQLVDG